MIASILFCINWRYCSNNESETFVQGSHVSASKSFRHSSLNLFMLSISSKATVHAWIWFYSVQSVKSMCCGSWVVQYVWGFESRRYSLKQFYLKFVCCFSMKSSNGSMDMSLMRFCFRTSFWLLSMGMINSSFIFYWASSYSFLSWLYAISSVPQSSSISQKAVMLAIWLIYGENMDMSDSI